MSGVEVRDPETNARLMTEQRETIVTNFKRAGHRTVALMPGLRQAWPEGGFYGFDDIYGASRLDYHGPEFGWFAVPDQFSLAKFDALERQQPSTRAAVRLLPDHQHALPVHPDAAVPAGLEPDVPRASV